MTSEAGDASTRVPPFVRRRRSVAGWIGLVVALIVFGAVALVIGVAAVVVVVAALVVRMLGRLGAYLLAWLWFVGRHGATQPYPFALTAPTTARGRRLALDGAFLRLLPRAVGMGARLCAPLLAPLALLASLGGLVLPGWRTRPYIAVFTLPALMRKAIGIGTHTGLLNDGDEAIVEPYDDYLRHTFPPLEQFVDWWRSGGEAHGRRAGGGGARVGRAGEGVPGEGKLGEHGAGACRSGPADAATPGGEPAFRPASSGPEAPGLDRLTLGPAPDPFGIPGIAVAVMRRARILDLRDLMLSQGEIDDMGDPDLDGRQEIAVIRTVRRTGADGRRHWIVQLPSTRSWHPRPGQAPNDITADVTTLAMRETTLTRAALAAMAQAGIAPGEPVLVAGFSLGGAVVGQLTRSAPAAGYAISHAFTAGAANSRYRPGPGIRMLSIEHLLDTVPPVDGRRNPVHPPADGGSWTTVSAGPALAVRADAGELHFSPDYVATAGLLDEEGGRMPQVAEFLATAGEFFGEGQRIVDYAARRARFGGPQTVVPISINSAARRGIAPGDLRRQLRRVSGVVAVDVYRSQSGLPTTVLWNADVLVDSLRPWFERVERTVVYRAMLALLTRHRVVGLHLRVRARATPGILFDAAVTRMLDGSWRERVDVEFDSEAAEEEYLELLLPGGWASTVTEYPADAFE